MVQIFSIRDQIPLLYLRSVKPYALGYAAIAISIHYSDSASDWPRTPCSLPAPPPRHLPEPLLTREDNIYPIPIQLMSLFIYFLCVMPAPGRVSEAGREATVSQSVECFLKSPGLQY